MLLAIALSSAFATETCNTSSIDVSEGNLRTRLRANRPGEDCERDGNQDGDLFMDDSLDPDCDPVLRRLMDSCGMLDEEYPEGFSGTWGPIPGFIPTGTSGSKIVPLSPEPIQAVDTAVGELWVGQGGELPEGVLVIAFDAASVELAIGGGSTQVHAAFQLTEGLGESGVAIVAEERTTGLTIGLLDDATGLQWTAGPGDFVAPVIH